MTQAPERAMRWRVEGWDPSYGASTEIEPGPPSTAQVALDVELPAPAWRPLSPNWAAPGWPVVLFVDGVRRVDALGWVTEPETETATMALCASYAAGVVRCGPDGARLARAEVRRGLFTTSPSATDVWTRAGSYRLVRAAARTEPMSPGAPVGGSRAQLAHGQGGDITVLNLALQRDLTDAEVTVAALARDGLDQGDDLLVVDGPLRGRAHLPRALGFIKSHRSEYLPAEQHRLVGALRAGQRTPVFRLGTSWERYSWYLKLPEQTGAPWAGVVRLECSADMPTAEVVALADASAPMLARHASTEYKDSRAPQNLYPIAGLERELKHRLGDRALLYRAIRAAG